MPCRDLERLRRVACPEVVPEAAAELKDSTENQQNARNVLRNEQAPKEQVADQANEQQDEALENLADAKEILQEQLKKLAENKNQPEQKTKLE